MPRAIPRFRQRWDTIQLMFPLQVLVADDEAVSRTVVGAMLKKAGYPVIYAPDGEQAWRMLDSDDPPALALLDWEMPGLQGPEVVQRIRSKHLQSPPYVILLTSRDSSADIVQGCEPAPMIT
jgi:CheY-like chemotaxis protein